MFVAIFDLHAQYPVLSPFALSLGAAPSFVGLIMGVYSITHLPGNLLAGYGIDRFGSRLFIVFSLVGAGILLLFQSAVENPWQLLIIRSFSGFVLAFLSPACLALLAKLATDKYHQGKLMSGNGLVHTLASVVSPAAGAILVAKLGFSTAFVCLGWVLIVTGVLALFWIKDIPTGKMKDDYDTDGEALEKTPIPWTLYAIPLALSCSQGILFFELPLLKQSQDSIMTSGLLFAMVSLGSLVTLSMLFLNRSSSFGRVAVGSLSLALVFFGMAVHWTIPIATALFLIGMAKGVIYPALSTLLAQVSNSGSYGKIFAYLSISYSVGAFFGPILSGMVRDSISPYYLAFVALMLGLAFMPIASKRHSPTLQA